MRIGSGYDVHRLVGGRKLVLGGVDIDYPQGLLGHSDADVLVHAVIDALLGAAALGDIGRRFPDSDEQYRGISSLVLLGLVAKLLAEAGYKVVNIDSTIVAQKPRLAPFLPQMAANLAQQLDVSVNRVSVKATTTEGLGFCGEGLGIAVQAMALLDKKTQE